FDRMHEREVECNTHRKGTAAANGQWIHAMGQEHRVHSGAKRLRARWNEACLSCPRSTSAHGLARHQAQKHVLSAKLDRCWPWALGVPLALSHAALLRRENNETVARKRILPR